MWRGGLRRYSKVHDYASEKLCIDNMKDVLVRENL